MKMNKVLFGGFAAVAAIIVIASMVWDYQMYQDCRADGNPAYRCRAMLDGRSHYIVNDDMEERR